MNTQDAGGGAGAVVARIAASLRTDPLYVDPSLRSEVTPAQRHDIEQHLAHAPYPVYVVLYPSDDNDVFGGRPEDLLTRLQATGLGHGVYLASGSTVAPDAYGGIVDVHALASGVPALADLDGYTFDPIVTVATPPLTLGAAFDELTGLVARGPQAIATASDRAEATEEARNKATTPSTTHDGKEGGGGGTSALAVTGIVLAVVVVLVLLALTLRRRITRRTASPRTAQVFTLPDSALTRIRQAHDRRLEETARTELLALGERVEVVDLPQKAGRGDPVADAVRDALDRYDVARDVIDRTDPPDVLDLVGAIVLTRQGQAALDAAQRRRAWKPPRTCFLDPLHGLSTVTRKVAGAQGGASREGRDVPLCSQCRRDLGAGRDPDILEVERRGRAVHYFDSGLEPWASTGYGCFGDDLVVAWRRAARS